MKQCSYLTPEPGCLLDLAGLAGGGASLHDLSPYGNHGVITGALWARLPGDLACLSFDGVDDYVNVAATPELDITTGDVTVLLWFAKDSPNGNFDLLQKGVGNGAYTLYVYASNEVGFLKQGAAAAKSLTQVQAGKWHFVAGVKKASLGRVFLDGAFEAERTNFADFISKDNLLIGKGDDGPFAGRIARPRIYARALSALEILNIYQDEKSVFGVW